jgi:hypothetical protein
MKVKDLIDLLGNEDPNAEVRLVDWRAQEVTYDVSYNSQRSGVSQIPVRTVYLMPIRTTGRNEG